MADKMVKLNIYLILFSQRDFERYQMNGRKRVKIRLRDHYKIMKKSEDYSNGQNLGNSNYFQRITLK